MKILLSFEEFRCKSL